MLSSLIIALSMYSAIPMPQVEWKEDNMRWSLGFLPVVGIICTAFVGGWSALALYLGASPFFFAAVAVLLPIVIAGGFHMDGFLDAADGIFSRRDRETRLKIMKDPHCGPFAVLCCVGLLLCEAGAWCQLLQKPALLPLGCLLYIVSRSFTVIAGSRLPYTPTSTLGVLFADRAAKGVRILGIVEAAAALALLLGAGFLFGGMTGLIIAAVTGLAAVLFFLWYRHLVIGQFGGVTGDLLGFYVELSQGVLLLILAVCSLFLE